MTSNYSTSDFSSKLSSLLFIYFNLLGPKPNPTTLIRIVGFFLIDLQKKRFKKKRKNVENKIFFDYL